MIADIALQFGLRPLPAPATVHTTVSSQLVGEGEQFSTDRALVLRLRIRVFRVPVLAGDVIL